MHTRTIAGFLLTLGIATSCAQGTSPTASFTPLPQATPTSPPTALPSATPTLLPATATIRPTASPAPATPVPTVAIANAQLVTIPTADGARLYGELTGAGQTAVIFAVMGNCKPGWTTLAEQVAAQGFRVLTYRWRACEGTRVNNRTIRAFLEDARASIAYMRAQGATRIVLVGASLGGLASARLLVEAQADALVVIAAPPAIPDWDVAVQAADMASEAPKLFITAEDDATVPASATRELYELAAEPRQWQTYPGTDHGTDLLEGDSGSTLQERILAFLVEQR